MKETIKKCKICGKTTDYMYQLNDGVYCEECVEIGKVKQKMKLKTEELKERQ